MDIFAVPSSGPRFQERADTGQSPASDAFASLLGELKGNSPEVPAGRPSREEEPEELAADGGQATEPRGESRHEAAEETASRPTSEGKATSDEAAAKGTVASRAAANAEVAAEAAAPAPSAPTGTMKSLGQPAAAAPGTQPAQAANPLQNTGGNAQAALQATGQANVQAATAAQAAGLPAGQNAFRLPGQDAGLRGEVRVTKAAEAPRSALAGGTALAASLAGSSQSGVAPAQGGAAAAGASGTAPGPMSDNGGASSRGFAALAAEAAGQAQVQATVAGKDAGGVQVLPAATEGDILLPGGGLEVARSEAAQAPASTTRPTPLPPAPVPDQIALQMHRAVGGGKDRLTIQLHPAELGHLEIKLELGRDGPVRAVLAADKPETLELLQRDVRGLERALQNAGLQTDGNSIAFDLRGGGQQRPGQGFGQAAPETAQGEGAGDHGEASPSAARAEARHDGNVNIRV